MSFHDKGFWMGKGNGSHITEGDALFGNSSRLESKRSHQWFADATEAELFPHKRQAIESPNTKSISTYPTSHLSWDNVSVSALQSSPNQFIDRLLGSPDGNLNKKLVHDHDHDHDQLENGSSVDLSISYTIEDPGSYEGIRKVKDTDTNGTNFITMGPNPNYNEDDGNVTLMGHSYTGFDTTHRLTGSTSKDEENSISFDSFHDESEPINGYYIKAMTNYGLSFDQPTVKTLQPPEIKNLDVSNAVVVGNPPQVGKSKSKLETKQAKKEAPNSFPSNVRSLMATGILDGVPVKYVSLSKEELKGVIKGSGYLCGCESCNQTKALNAYEFERHAGCKTKHPNNHIYFESGKTIYQIVQELRSTPESLLFDAIQNVTGSPINQKAFRTWKESFQAATRELQRIYGKDELNI